MHKIISWYNANRKKVWSAIGILAFAIIVVQMLNGLVKQNKESQNIKNISTQSSSNSSTFNTISLETDKSVLSGSSLSSTQKSSLKILDQFIEYCNSGKVSEAYSLLSEDCKSQIYPNENIFKEIYYNKIFNGISKNITTENWIGNTYRVKFADNPLATGKYNQNVSVQDYITIQTTSNGEQKLNINNYLGKEEINVQKQVNNINFKVVEKHVYMDYEIYEYEITNLNSGTILLNDITQPGTLYLQDKNSVKYSAYTNELTESELKIGSKETKKVNIKYYCNYSSTKIITDIIFARIIFNSGDINQYYGQVKISL